MKCKINIMSKIILCLIKNSFSNIHIKIFLMFFCVCNFHALTSFGVFDDNDPLRNIKKYFQHKKFSNKYYNLDELAIKYHKEEYVRKKEALDKGISQLSQAIKKNDGNREYEANIIQDKRNLKELIECRKELYFAGLSYLKNIEDKFNSVKSKVDKNNIDLLKNGASFPREPILPFRSDIDAFCYELLSKNSFLKITPKYIDILLYSTDNTDEEIKNSIKEFGNSTTFKEVDDFLYQHIEREKRMHIFFNIVRFMIIISPYIIVSKINTTLSNEFTSITKDKTYYSDNFYSKGLVPFPLRLGIYQYINDYFNIYIIGYDSISLLCGVSCYAFVFLQSMILGIDKDHTSLPIFNQFLDIMLRYLGYNFLFNSIYFFAFDVTIPIFGNCIFNFTPLLAMLLYTTPKDNVKSKSSEQQPENINTIMNQKGRYDSVLDHHEYRSFHDILQNDQKDILSIDLIMKLYNI